MNHHYPFENVPLSLHVFLSEIRRIRKDKGLTQTQLADATGLSMKTISFVETGKFVTTESLEKIAEALGVAVIIETKTNYFIKPLKTKQNGKIKNLITRNI